MFLVAVQIAEDHDLIAARDINLIADDLQS